MKINIDARKIAQKKQRRFERSALPVLSHQVLEDSNKYVRKDQGALEKSSITQSIPEKGLLVWSTPYAKRVYYTGNPCRDVNPNASLMWFDKAKSVYGQRWTMLARKLMK